MNEDLDLQAAATPIPDTTPPKRRRQTLREVVPQVPQWRIQLKDNPTLVIAAVSVESAVEQYKRQCGIISTIHQFKIEEVK